MNQTKNVEKVIEKSNDEYKTNRGRGNIEQKKITYADVVKGNGITNDESKTRGLKISK